MKQIWIDEMIHRLDRLAEKTRKTDRAGSRNTDPSVAPVARLVLQQPAG
jgi:hypothetical protein